MKVAKFGFIALPAAWLLVISATPEAAQSKTVNAGVFTEAQAARGEEAFKKDCSSCHGAGLTGDGSAPGLAGAEFLSNWNGTSVGDLFDRIRISMPPGSPASVPNTAKADIIAFVLKFNKFPAGATELASSTDVLKDIAIELPK
jgi:S-disulfanyl-L-cysteine oxidoreductase SoxD